MSEELGKDFKALLELTKLIHGKDVRDFTYMMLTEKAPAYFKHISASSSNKYHPKTSLGEAGLVRHVISATKILHHLVYLEYLQIVQAMIDCMLSAIMLHDIVKQGIPNEDGTSKTGHTTKDHERIGAQFILDNSTEEFMPKAKIIADLVSRHAGQWQPKRKPNNRFTYLVHSADYLASRPDIVVDVEAPSVDRSK